MRPALLVLAALALGLAAPAPASAGDPIMPLGEVRTGMRCTAWTVLQGTEITPFDAQVVDVVSGDPMLDAPRILVRFSGEAIERTGVGQGFSGSPIYCPDQEGVPRVIGAVSEGVGEYGSLLALATPIESVLGQPVDPPSGMEPSPAARRARRLGMPLSISGLSPRVGRVLRRAAARRGRLVTTLPGRPRAAGFPAQQLRPGASMSAGLASGDVTAGAIGTVTYVDGDRVWGFGHPLDGTGRRALLLQDAYVYAVVANPLEIEEARTYKLAAPGHDLGTLSGDGFSAVAGRLGVLPERVPMRVVARDGDTGRRRVWQVQLADEAEVGLPTGISALSAVGSGVVAQAAAGILGSSPGRQTGRMCARFHLRERRRALRFCNRYVTRATADSEDTLGVGGPMLTDFAEATTAIDDFNFAVLDVTGVEVTIDVRRGLRQAFLLEGRAPDVVRRGRRVRVRLEQQVVQGRRRWRTVRVKVPRRMPRGRRVLTLEGAPSDSGAGLELDLGELLFGGDDGSEPGEAGPRTVRALARSIARIARYDGVTASFQPVDADDLSADDVGDRSDPEAIARRPRRVLRDPDLRLSGRVRIPVTVR